MPIPELQPTGERLIKEFAGSIVCEHLHRYALAAEFTPGRDVLDIACGEGYGSMQLAHQARSVVGIDISPDTIAHACHCYKHPNLSFLVGNCVNIPLQSASIDMVVSFETLEHFDQHREFLSEIKRVLRPGGLLIISSPDKKTYSDRSGQKNPFHVKELYHKEFAQLLNSFFPHTLFGKQIHNAGTGITFSSTMPRPPAQTLTGNFQTFSRDRIEEEGIYSIAIGSDAPLPAIADSLYSLDSSLRHAEETLITAQLFTASSPGDFCEERSLRVLFKPGTPTTVSFKHIRQFDPHPILHLRLDPSGQSGSLRLGAVMLKDARTGGIIRSFETTAPHGLLAFLPSMLRNPEASDSWICIDQDPQIHFPSLEADPDDDWDLEVVIEVNPGMEGVVRQQLMLINDLESKWKGASTRYERQLSDSRNRHEQSLAELRNAAEKRQQQCERLQADLLEKVSTIGYIQNQLTSVTDKVRRMQDSYSWRITEPLRYIRRSLFDRRIK